MEADGRVVPHQSVTAGEPSDRNLRALSLVARRPREAVGCLRCGEATPPRTKPQVDEASHVPYSEVVI